MRIEEAWPLLGISVRVGALELRYARDEDVVALGGLLADGLLPPGEEHYLLGAMRSFDPDRATTVRNVLAYHWSLRASARSTSWDLPLAIRLDGVTVGEQSVRADDFAVLGEVASGSYLAPWARGRGIGTRARAMALELVFAHLGASSARSSYALGNAASARVSEKLGYEPDGTMLTTYRGVRHPSRRVVLTRERWEAHRDAERLEGLVVEGGEEARDLLGARE